MSSHNIRPADKAPELSNNPVLSIAKPGFVSGSLRIKKIAQSPKNMMEA